MTIRLPAIAWRVLLPGVLLASLSTGSADSTPVSFRTEVLPLISKAGCNAGTCHGNANGKAGFKLSLRGQDPDLDHLALTRDMFGRRTNPLEPEQSLILLKATMQVSHEGGLRFTSNSPEYERLRRWIMEGAQDDGAQAPRLIRLEVSPLEEILTEPSREVQLRAQAVFSDGATRDVTSWAVYEPSVTWVTVSHDGQARAEKNGEATVIVRFLEQQVPVRLAFIPNRPEFAWSNPPAHNEIDERVYARLRQLRIHPSELCSDHDFIRRAYLDLLGVPPTGEEARRFVEDASPNKRAELVDGLLGRSEFADFWASKWSDLLRNEEKSLDRKGVQSFHHWIRQSLAENKPLDQFVREILAARGSTYDHPAANYYRALRDPIARAESTAQLFLGTRLQCAKCHNHPFDRWTQADYYDWANLFARVQYKVLENRRRDTFDKHEFIGEQIVWMAREGSVVNPKTGASASSRFLDMSGMESGDAPVIAERGKDLEPSADGDTLQSLAVWLTSPDNPLFARSQANRIWYHLMGRGIVDPIDDFRPTNPPSNPRLLDYLTADFTASGFDLRHLIRRIMLSRTYQLSAEPNDTNREDETQFSHALIRRLSAEQLLDAQCRVLDVSTRFNGFPEGTRAGQLPGVRAVRPRDQRPSGGDMFLTTFGKPERLLTCECERSDETTMNQAFQLISGPTLHDLLTVEDNRLGRLLTLENSPESVVRELYWQALSRPPAPREAEAAEARLRSADNKRRGLEDLAWALLNAKEFVLRK